MIVIACAPGGIYGGTASCTTVTADCHASDRGLRPAVADSTFGMRHLLVKPAAEDPLVAKTGQRRRL